MKKKILYRCDSHFRNPAVFNILKEPLLIQKQTLHQQKALDLSFNLTPWKRAWNYHEGVTMTCRKRTFFTSRAPMLFAARGRGALLIMPCPLLGSQIKAEIKGFLLRYRLLQCTMLGMGMQSKIFWHWFFNFNVTFSMYIMTISS